MVTLRTIAPKRKVTKPSPENLTKKTSVAGLLVMKNMAAEGYGRRNKLRASAV
jgi:hypothetical protein